MRRLTRFSMAVALLTLAALVLRFWRLGEMPLFADEAYYLLWAQRLAPAYFDHPAGIAFLLRLSTLLGGPGETGVRWLNALVSVACVPLAYAVGLRYVGRTGGMVAAAALALAPVYVLTGRVAYPDSLHYLLLLVNLLAFAAVLAGSTSRWRWAWLGLTLALLLNVKLSSSFYAIGLALYVLLWRRTLLRQGGPWLAAAIAALGLIPLLAWNVAHGWVGVRWAIYQGQGFGFARLGPMATAAHAWSYLTPPVVLLAATAVACFLVGLVRARRPSPDPLSASRPAGPWPLALVAACLLAPVFFSAANNPRNLGIGLLAVWPLAGVPAMQRRVHGLFGLVLRPVVIGLLAWAGVFGAGSAAALLDATALPHAGAAPVIRLDAAGWPAFGQDFAPPGGSLIYAVDYSIAGQVSYYSGLPVHSSGGQFRAWGIPEATDLTVLSQTFVPPSLITARLQADFAQVDGPEMWRTQEGEPGKTILIWQARGRRVAMSKVVDDLDYISLAQTAGNALR